MRWIRWPGLRPLLCNPIDRHRVPLTPSIRSLSSHISALCFFPSRFTQLTLPTAPATLEVFFFSSSIEFPPAPERERGGQDEHSRRAHPVVVLFAYGCENEARAHYIRRQVCICSCETTGASIYITCLVRLSECFFLCVCGGLDGRIYTAGVLYPNRYPADNPTSRLMFWLCVYCSDRGIIYIYIHSWRAVAGPSQINSSSLERNMRFPTTNLHEPTLRLYEPAPHAILPPAARK